MLVANVCKMLATFGADPARCDPLTCRWYGEARGHSYCWHTAHPTSPTVEGALYIHVVSLTNGTILDSTPFYTISPFADALFGLDIDLVLRCYAGPRGYRRAWYDGDNITAKLAPEWKALAMQVARGEMPGPIFLDWMKEQIGEL